MDDSAWEKMSLALAGSRRRDPSKLTLIEVQLPGFSGRAKCSRARVGRT